MAVSTASIISSPVQRLFAIRSCSPCNSSLSVSNPFGTLPLRGYCHEKKGNVINITTKVSAAAVASPTEEETKEYVLPTWADFDLGKAPVFWKTMNGLLPTSGEKLTIFHNPMAKNLALNDEFGVAFNGGFNQPIMCGGEPRTMLKKTRGKADPPFYTIRICVPKHAISLIFSFTNGSEWDGPYKIQFASPKAWRNKPLAFFNEGLAEELGQDGACEKAIFPDSDIVQTRCRMIGNLSVEGGDRCDLNFVTGCTDPSSPEFNPLANVDDGSCPPYSDSESEE
ncbi:hypothetical protein MKW94_007965 [Papaver nudicaule]|uniref:PIFI-like Ig-like domain-containing protein n=1 Tax=Papaver nudicaule TaxID=74823 RepID=A0AA41W0Q0_PAPNU|nr:hypothetical protein [Papaver nudicaule]